MPLDIEQESEDLLRTALEKLRSRMSDRGAYELGGNYDALDRALSSGVEGGGNYRSALESAKEIAPTLLDDVLGKEAPLLDRMNLAGGGGSVSSPYSGPVYNDGALGQLQLQTGQFRPATLAGAESSGLPPGYSSSRFMAPKAPSPNAGFFYAGSEQPLAETLERNPGPDNRNRYTPIGWTNEMWSAPKSYDERGEQAERDAFLARGPVTVPNNPGFKYSGAPEFESTALGEYASSPIGQRAFLDEWSRKNPPTPEAWSPDKARVVQIPDLPGSVFIETGPNKWTLRSSNEGGGSAIDRILNEGRSSAPSAASDRVTVISPQGKRGSIPRSQLAEALKAGYRQ